jgi:hypothetical protein
VVVELANFGRNFTDLPSLEAIFRIQDLSMLLLEFPEFGVDVEGAAKICLPLFVTILRQISERG